MLKVDFNKNIKDDTHHLQVKELNVHCPCCWTTPARDSQTHCKWPSSCLCRTNTAIKRTTKSIKVM